MALTEEDPCQWRALTIPKVWVAFTDSHCVCSALRHTEKEGNMVERKYPSHPTIELCHSLLRNSVFPPIHILVQFSLAHPGMAHLLWLCKIGEIF